jgi:hypothetical protein
MARPFHYFLRPFINLKLKRQFQERGSPGVDGDGVHVLTIDIREMDILIQQINDIER